MEMPAMAKILLVFAAMLAVTRLRVPLGLALVMGGAGLVAWVGFSPVAILKFLGLSLTHLDLWLLLLITTLIIEFGRILTADHNARAITAAARRWGGRHGRAASIMIVPAVIGLVPMPGGALFSAPLVSQTVHEKHWSPEWKTAINYWFRHVWEYWWPLYPVIIVTLSIFKVETWQFMAVQFPFTLVAIGAGFVFLVRPHLRDLSIDVGDDYGDPSRAALLALPLGVIIACTLLFPYGLAAVAPSMGLQTRKLMSILLGLIWALPFIRAQEPPEARTRLFSHFLTHRSLNVLFTLAGVLVFKYLLDVSGLLPLAADDLVAAGIPVVLVVAILPFVAGFVTGIAIGFAGASFPLAAGLIAAEGSGLSTLSTLVLAFAFGYAGMMLSPVHLCLLLTKDYFSAPFSRIYRHLVPCVLTLMAAGAAMYGLLRALGL